MGILFLNFIIYAIWSFMIFHKERKLTVYSFMVIVFTIIAFLGYYTVYNGIYYDTFGYYSPNRLV